jgi:hypothetical protein
MSYKPGTIEIQWSIHAMTRGIGGITAAHHTTGSAREATDAMIDWLQSRDVTTDANVDPEIELWAELRSDQAVKGSARKVNVEKGLPAKWLVEYSVDALRDWAKSRTWGGGGF